VSQEPGRYGKSCDTYDRRNLPESNWNGGTTDEVCEKPCNQGFCTARTLNQQSCPPECKQDDSGNCCVNIVSVEGEEGDATGICVPSRYGDNQKYTGKNSLGWGSYGSASLDDWYRDSACRGAYPGDSGNFGTSVNQMKKNPYTCHKSDGSSSILTEIKPFADDISNRTRSIRRFAHHYGQDDRPTTGWEGVLNNRGIDRAYGSEGQKSCETAPLPELFQAPITNFCTWIDIKNYGTKSSRSQRQFWYDEMNKD